MARILANQWIDDPQGYDATIRDGALWIVQNKTGAYLGVEITGELAAVIARINERPRRAISAYPMVYHPASITFMRIKGHEGGALQFAEIIDGQGRSWLALFSLEQQPDASWRISGCVVAENLWLPI